MKSPRDLWDFLPPPVRPVQGNYVTRKIYQWIACDPSVEYRCRACALRCKAEAGRDALALLAIRLRAILVEEGLRAEPDGLFFEIFTQDLGEADFAELARYYLDVIAKTNGRNSTKPHTRSVGLFIGVSEEDGPRPIQILSASSCDLAISRQASSTHRSFLPSLPRLYRTSAACSASKPASVMSARLECCALDRLVEESASASRFRHSASARRNSSRRSSSKSVRTTIRNGPEPVTSSISDMSRSVPRRPVPTKRAAHSLPGTLVQDRSLSWSRLRTPIVSAGLPLQLRDEPACRAEGARLVGNGVIDLVLELVGHIGSVREVLEGSEEFR